jgi:hypothetical protein
VPDTAMKLRGLHSGDPCQAHRPLMQVLRQNPRQANVARR